MKELQVSLFQVLVLLLFNESENSTFEEIKQATAIGNAFFLIYIYISLVVKGLELCSKRYMFDPHCATRRINPLVYEFELLSPLATGPRYLLYEGLVSILFNIRNKVKKSAFKSYLDFCVSCFVKVSLHMFLRKYCEILWESA